MLIGDAAHPQTPFLGQGVNTAVIDAFVLAEELNKSEGDQKKALVRYDRRRLEVNNKTVRWARLYGWLFLARNVLLQSLIKYAIQFSPSWLIQSSISRHDRLHSSSLFVSSSSSSSFFLFVVVLIMGVFLALVIALI